MGFLNWRYAVVRSVAFAMNMLLSCILMYNLCCTLVVEPCCVLRFMQYRRSVTTDVLMFMVNMRKLMALFLKDAVVTVCFTWLIVSAFIFVWSAWLYNIIIPNNVSNRIIMTKIATLAVYIRQYNLNIQYGSCNYVLSYNRK